MPTDEELVLGRYEKQQEVDARLGGRAFLAEDLEAGRAPVEVHLLPQGKPADLVKEAARAVEALAETKDPVLARPLAVVPAPDALVLVCERAPEGATSLAQVLAQGELEPERALAVLRGLLRALSLLGHAKVAHGGIVPRRVLLGGSGVAGTDAGARVVLVDAGFAALGPTPAASDARFVAPAPIEGEAADVFAAATIALELLVGEACRARAGEALVAALFRARENPRAGAAEELLAHLPAATAGSGRRRPEYGVEEVLDALALGASTRRSIVPVAARPAVAEARGPVTPYFPKNTFDGFIDAAAAQSLTLSGRPVPPPPPPPAPLPPPHVHAAPLPPTPPPPPPAVVWRAEPAPVPAAPPVVWKPEPTPVAGKHEPAAVVWKPEPAPVVWKPEAAPAPAPAPAPVPAPAPAAGPAAKAEPAPARAANRAAKPEPTPRAASKAKKNLLFVLEKGGQRRHVFLVTGTTVSFGRERGNQVILRAFKQNGELDSTETNRMSRKHLTVTMGESRVTVRDDKSAFHTTVGPRGKPEQIPKGAEVDIPVEFEVGFAVTAVRVKGKVFMDASGHIECVRFARADEEAAHTYLCHRTRTTIGGSEKEDALVIEGAPAGAAQLELDAQGHVLVRARGDAVSVGGKPVAPGDAVPIAPKAALAVGKVTISVREYADDDFFKPAWAK